MELEGYVNHIIYRNQSNGYSVLVVDLDDEKEEITMVGMFRHIEEGQYIVATGEYVEHPTYDTQFKVSSYEIKEMTDIRSIRRYLASGAIKGIGVALADRIVKKFGEDTLRIMEEEPEQLAKIKGISERMACEIGMQAEAKKELKNAMMFLQNYGISNALAVKIYDTYGVGMYGVLQSNPYKLSEDISGVGFHTADEIAKKIGIHTDSDFRIRSGILYVLSSAMGEGHLFLPEQMLIKKCEELLEFGNYTSEEEATRVHDMLKVQVENLAMDRKLVLKNMESETGGEVECCVYSTKAYRCELGCANLLCELSGPLGGNAIFSQNEEQVLKKIQEIEAKENIVLDDLQRDAVLKSVFGGVTVLTGGPGTGKTTTINTIIRFFDREGMDIYLAAPTGRAAKRMTEATGYEAKTIHRLLEVSGESDADASFFERNEENPLEADVVIIDEMSMVDIFLFYSLLKAIPVGTRLILVGDRDQLPSVGPGKVLKDMIESECFTVVKLQKIFRQAGESDIVMNAHKIHEGKPIRMDNQSKDFFFLPRNDVNQIYQNMIKLITDMLPRNFDTSPMEIQVLTPTRKGALGVESLNEILQRYLNPESPKKIEHQYGSILFREGDKVMQMKNNYKIEWEILSKYNIPIDKGVGVFNGDTGIIKSINTYAETVTVEFEEHKQVTYPFQELDQLELAYAITVHKAQGSEYPAVVMPLLGVPKMLTYRNLFYTAVTRARKCVTLLGSKELVEAMIANGNEQKRYSGLKIRIQERYSLEEMPF